MEGPSTQQFTPVASHRGTGAPLHSDVKDERSSDEMNYADLDWSPDGRKWGKRREGAGPSSSYIFHPSDAETYQEALARVKHKLEGKLEADYVRREGRAFEMAKHERAHLSSIPIPV